MQEPISEPPFTEVHAEALAAGADKYESGGRVTFRDLYGAIRDNREENCRNLEQLKADQKGDLLAMEGRLLEAFNNLRDEFRSLRTDTATRISELDAKGTAGLEAHIEADRLAKAKAEGRNEVFTRAQGLVTKNWKMMLIVFAAVVAFLTDADLTWGLSLLGIH